MMIYDFSELRKYVKDQLGIDADATHSRYTAIRKVIAPRNLDDTVEITGDGITITDIKGRKHKGFLFIEGGYTQQTIEKSGTRLPKYHIANCNTIREQKERLRFNGHYVFSNKKEEMEDIDGKIYELGLCGNCAKLYTMTTKGMKTSEFINGFIGRESDHGQFDDDELPQPIPTTFWGYTSDWDVTSKAYRESKRFTCEKCGLRLDGCFAEGYYLETHHIDGNPLNNDEKNLKCLCVLCHANVNKYHEENYSKGSAKQKLKDFVKMYEDALIAVKNPYLVKVRNW